MAVLNRSLKRWQKCFLRRIVHLTASSALDMGGDRCTGLQLSVDEKPGHSLRKRGTQQRE